MLKILALAILSLLLVSCLSPVSQPQPEPSNWKSQVKAQNSARLADPLSAQYIWTMPEPKLGKSGYGPVYQVDYKVNAKNAFGGYVGFERARTMFVDGSAKHSYYEKETPFSFISSPY